jgi:non-heme chloroperoxidase
VVRYLARHGETRVAKAAIISAVPPLMVRTAANPGGLPKEVFDDFQAQLATSRSEFYRAVWASAISQTSRGKPLGQHLVLRWWSVTERHRVRLDVEPGGLSSQEDSWLFIRLAGVE